MMTMFEKCWGVYTVSLINTSTFLKRSHLSYLLAYEDGTECSETSAYKIQTPENYPEESIQYLEQSESLKSRIDKCFTLKYNNSLQRCKKEDTFSPPTA